MSTTHFPTSPQRSWTRFFFQTLIAAHSSIQSLPERRKAELVAALSLSFSIIIAGGLAATLQIAGFSILIGVGFLFSAVSFVSYLISRSVFYHLAPLFFVGGFALLAYTASVTGPDPALFLTISFAVLFLLSNLFDLKQMIWFITINLVAALLVSVFFMPQLQGVAALNTRAGLFTIGLFVLLFAWHRSSLENLRLEEVTLTQTELQQSNIQLQNAQREVNARFTELRLAAEVGRTVSQVRDLQSMLADAVELIRSRFGLYYSQVYLVNPSQTYLTLQAGTGRVGEELLSRNHRLVLDTGSINGRAAIEKSPVIVADTKSDPAFKPNPILPNTRSEMAVPLLIGETVVGVLDMQSESAGSLNKDILPAFEALAGQLAIAIQNATFLAETEQARAEVEAQARRLTRANWVEYLDAIHKPEETGFLFEHNKITTLTQSEQTQTEENNDALVAPITITGEALGNLIVEMEGQSPISRTDELLTTVARQVAQQIENLRLIESAERYRNEAEKAARLQTIEGWQNYVESRAAGTLGYLYDTNEIRPQNGSKEDEEASMFVMPLKARDEAIGKLAVRDLTADDHESVELVSAVAERLSAHIENLRLFEETRQGQFELDKRARQLASVAEISTISSRELDISKLLETVATLTKDRFNLYHAHVYLLDETSNTLKLTAGAGDVGRQMMAEGWQIPIDHQNSIVARAARTRQFVISNNIIRDKESVFLSNRLLPDTRSELAMPLMVGDKVLGVFDIQSDRANAFTEEDANIQTTLATQVATALQNARSFNRAQQQAERESTLNVISQKIQSATTVEAVLQIAARELGHALGAPMTIAKLNKSKS